MKKHYRGLAIALSAAMIAGSSFTAFAGPADEANGAQPPQQSQGQSPAGDGMGAQDTNGQQNQDQQGQPEQPPV